MAIYTMTDLKTGETQTVSSFTDLYEKNKIEGGTYEEFENQLTSSEFLQRSYGFTLEPIDLLPAIENAKAELKDAAKRQKDAKANLQQFTATALADVAKGDDNEVDKAVEDILKKSSQSAANVQKWFEPKGKDKTPLITHVTLPEHVKDALERHETNASNQRDAANT